MCSFLVLVMDINEKPLQGALVRIEFTSPERALSALEYTTVSGVANFRGQAEGQVKVFVNGKDFGTYYYEDNGKITIWT
ncbi:MAG TPA: hypothetical protein DEO84_11355 [candidate division Zixibacteria bacterium]|jgi:hypothetical protein|nr:hypothetical protein [candidate division Zixibacteria bacterium]HBZ01905.1 hypothetical protein [candidate division Zixibacteria bacterium]